MSSICRQFILFVTICAAICAAGGCGAKSPVADASADFAEPSDGGDNGHVPTSADCPAAPPMFFDSCSEPTLHCVWDTLVCDCDHFNTWECADSNPDLLPVDMTNYDFGHCTGGIPVCAATNMDGIACATVGDVCGNFAECADRCTCTGPEKLWVCCGSLSGNVCDPTAPVKTGDLCCANTYVGGCTYDCLPDGGAAHCDCVDSHFICTPDSCPPALDGGTTD